VIANLSDETLVEEFSDHLSGDRSVDLELVDKFRHGDGQELRCLLDDSIVALLIEEDRVVKLFLDLDLGPALLLCLGASSLFAWKSASLGSLVRTFGVLLVLLLCLYTTKNTISMMRK
jgi:hypothetical protein